MSDNDNRFIFMLLFPLAGPSSTPSSGAAAVMIPPQWRRRGGRGQKEKEENRRIVLVVAEGPGYRIGLHVPGTICFLPVLGLHADTDRRDVWAVHGFQVTTAHCESSAKMRINGRSARQRNEIPKNS
jgi:hypothetical protein